MYIPIWLLVLIVVGGLLIYRYNKKRASDKPTTIKKMTEQAEYYKSLVLEKSPWIEEYLQDERDLLNAMESDVIRLRERYKHDEENKIVIARDWMDFSNAILVIKNARERLDVDIEDTAFDAYHERTNEANIVVQEVKKRMEVLLGEESSLKAVLDRINKNDASARLGADSRRGYI